MQRRLAVLFTTALLPGLPAVAASVHNWSAAAGVSSALFESHPAVDPRNGDLYFVRSSPQFTGWKILLSRCTKGNRAPPVPAPFSGEGVEADPYFTPDGRRVYFISSRRELPGKTTEDLDIWYAERTKAGSWGAPVRLPPPVNSRSDEWCPRITASGALYFGSGRPGGFGKTDIYRAERHGSAWTLTNVGGSVSTSDDDYEFEPASDGSFGILMSGGSLYRVERSAAGWGARIAVDTGAKGFHVGPTLSPSGKILLFSRGTAGRSGEIFRHGSVVEQWPRNCVGEATAASPK